MKTQVFHPLGRQETSHASGLMIMILMTIGGTLALILWPKSSYEFFQERVKACKPKATHRILPGPHLTPRSTVPGHNPASKPFGRRQNE